MILVTLSVPILWAAISSTKQSATSVIGRSLLGSLWRADFDRVLATVYWPCLQSVELESLCLDPVRMSDFFERHAVTLRKVSISDVAGFSDSECLESRSWSEQSYNDMRPPVMVWVRILTRMRHRLKLDQVKLDLYVSFFTHEGICQAMSLYTRPHPDEKGQRREGNAQLGEQLRARLCDFTLGKTPCGCMMCIAGGWKLEGKEDNHVFEKTGRWEPEPESRNNIEDKRETSEGEEDNDEGEEDTDEGEDFKATG